MNTKIKPFFHLLFIVCIFTGIGFAQGLLDGKIMTVLGPIEPAAMGVTLTHEHVMVDFIGADKVNPNRYDPEEVFQVALPFLKQAFDLGCRTFVECTPNYLARDPKILERLSKSTGLHILTNTGYYGAAGDKAIPKHAYEETADQLAQRWIHEWENGIGDTGIRPGFIKIGVDGGSLSAIDKKIVTAAAIAHRKSGLVIASHTGDQQAGQEELRIIEQEGIRPDGFIWVHSQNVADTGILINAAKKGVWISLDGVGPDSIPQYSKTLNILKKEGLLNKVLLSHDAGWYNVGDPKGGKFRSFETIFTKLIPAIKTGGFTPEEIKQITVDNPAQAFQIQKRLLTTGIR